VILRVIVLMMLMALNSLHLCAAEEPSKSNVKEAGKSVSIFKGVDGVTYSTVGTKRGKYEKYLDRESAVTLSNDQLEKLISELKEAGFLSEKDRELKLRGGVPPESFIIVLSSDGQTRECKYYYHPESAIPEKFLAAFERLPEDKKPKIVAEILELNRKVLTDK
jgi:hypothetical protein